METADLRAAPRSVHVEAKADHLQSLAKSRPINALAEIIWNALDADADEVRVEVDDNALGTPEVIRVSDNGSGIPLDRATTAFGNLGESWKKGRLRTLRHEKRLHGRDGKGRFKAFALGNRVTWATTFRGLDEQVLRYEIKGSYENICDFPFTEPAALETAITGTVVTISGITESLGILSDESGAEEQLAELFAIYLRDYPATRIYFRGARIDIAAVQSRTRTIPLTPFFDGDGNEVQAAVEVIEWAFTKRERKLCLCDASGYTLHEIELTIRPGSDFNFTAYLKSDYIARLHEENLIGVAEMRPELVKLVDEAHNKLRAYFRQRKAATAGGLVDEWKREGIYPFQGDAVDAVDQARREVFDICAVNVNEYLDSFKQAAKKDRKLTLRLIATAVDESPDSLKKILGDVLELPKDKLRDFAELLDHTTLPQMIEASKTVSDRLTFLKGLQALLFDPELKRATKERKHLQKLLEVETWIFGEEYLLTNADENLNTVLRTHLERLRPTGRRKKSKSDEKSVVRDDGSEGVIDLMLARELPQYGKTRREFLVVELKRPSQKIDLEVKSQIESYALAVVRDERFDKANTEWTFVAISTDMTEDARQTVHQRDKPVGFFLVGDNFRVGLATWAEVIRGSEVRLEMFRAKLGHTATKDDGIKLLHTKYKKFLPQAIEDAIPGHGE